MNLNEQMAFAYEHAPAVRALFDRAGIAPDAIRDIKDLEQLPVTSKDSMMEMQQADPPFGGWNAVPITEMGAVFLSPGPLFDAHDAAMMENAGRVLQDIGFGPGDIVLNGFMYHMVPAGLLFHEGMQQAGATVVPMGPGNTDLQVQVMLALGINGYVGTPSFLSLILDKAEDMNIPREAIPMKKAFFTGEPYPASLRQRFEGDYGMTTAQSYATADLGIIAYQMPGDNDFILRDDIIIELVDPQTGQPVPDGTPGEVVVTTFSRVYPLIRYGTGDMAVMVPGTNRLFGLVGRSGDAVKVRGMFLHPNQLNFVLPQLPGVQAWEAVVSRENNRDELTLNLVTSQPLEEAHVKQMVKQTARLTVDRVNFVDSVQEAGKVRDLRDWE